MKYMKPNGREAEMDNTFLLIGMLNVFMNRYQTVADRFFGEISWKQCFLIICIGIFDEPPALKEVAQAMGTSHQNVKQMLLKLEKQGFVDIIADAADKRKQRIVLTQKAAEFNRENDEPSQKVMDQLFSNLDKKDLEITVKTVMSLIDRLEEMEKL